MRRLRLAMVASVVATGCAGLIGVPDLSFDETAGGPDGSLSFTDSSQGPDDTGTTGPDATTCGADLATDLQNCGRCGHDCTNGICTNGLCTLTPDLPSARALALENGTVFIGLAGGPDGADRQGIVSCPTSGCTKPLVAPIQVSPPDAGTLQSFGLAVNAATIYSTNNYGFNDNGGIYRLDRATHVLTHLATTQATTAAAAMDTKSFYWTENQDPGNVWYCDIATCATPTKISASRYPEQLVVANDGRIVFHGNGVIMTCAGKDTCATTGKTLPSPRVLTTMAQDPTDSSVVFWSTAEVQPADKALVQRCSTNPGCTVPTTIAEETDPVVALAVSGGSVYWATLAYDDARNEFDSTKGTIRTCKLGTDGKCDAMGPRTIASNQASPSTIVVDANSVYWANDGHHGSSDGKAPVMKAPR